MTDWAKARCIGQTGLFFDDRPSQIAKAKAICEDCPIKRPCLKFALEHREAWGIWGGVGYAQLRRLAAQKGLPGPAQRRLPEHGTERGWAWHRRRKAKDPGHVVCDPCLLAYNVATRIRVQTYRTTLADKKKKSP